MNKLAILPLFLLTMCGTAPVTPPAEAIPQEQVEQIWWEALGYMKNYEVLKNRTEPDDAINSALDDFWEVQNGSDGSTEQEKLL